MPTDGADFGRTRPCYGRAYTMARDGADNADVAECVMRGVELDIRRDGGAPAYPVAVDLLTLASSGGLSDQKLLAGVDAIRRDFVDSPLTRHFAAAVETIGLSAIVEGRSLSREQAPPSPGPTAGFFERVGAPYRPRDDAQWVTRSRYGEGRGEQAVAAEAWRAPTFAFFRWFASYPVLYRVDNGGAEGSCAWFEDLRFITPGRTGVPFRYGMCSAPGGAWQAFELRADGSYALVY